MCNEFSREATDVTITRNGRTSMNVMLSNLSHDLDVSLAYSIDKKVWGVRTE
jgi:hypothetical protein